MHLHTGACYFPNLLCSLIDNESILRKIDLDTHRDFLSSRGILDVTGMGELKHRTREKKLKWMFLSIDLCSFINHLDLLLVLEMSMVIF